LQIGLPRHQRVDVLAAPLAVGFRFQRQGRRIVDAAILGRSRDDIALAPVAHGPADVLARHAGHRGQIALADLVAQFDPAAMLFAGIFRKVEQRAGHRPLTVRNVDAARASSASRSRRVSVFTFQGIWQKSLTNCEPAID
jgi:hypothetical protein